MGVTLGYLLQFPGNICNLTVDFPAVEIFLEGFDDFG